MNPTEFRRHLHAHPELSFKEHDTAAFIEQQLDELSIEHRRIASTGVVARIKGRKTPEGDRRAAVLRADIDALPVTERNDCEWRSQNEGVMHACGHDMHAAVLFGVLKTFAEAPDFRGTLFGLFQPGEECNPGGASLVLAEKPFEGYDVRAVVGEHVEPQLEVGTLGFRAGKYMAASDELRFRVRGTGGHGAMRKQLKDPVAAGAELLTRLIALNGEECVLSIGRVEAGGATNIVPDEIYMEGTLRTFDERERGIIHRRIGIIGGKPNLSRPSLARLAGCQGAMLRLGLPFDMEKQYAYARFSLSSGYEAMEYLLKHSPDITAVFAMSDLMALGAIRALRDHGLCVPQDISVTGFDGIALGQYSVPRLTTIRQNMEQLARRSARILLHNIQKPGNAVHEIVSFDLTEGESVREL